MDIAKRFLILSYLILFINCRNESKDCAGGMVGGDNLGKHSLQGPDSDEIICGCMDSTAINFDSLASFDDESCIYDSVSILF